MLKDDEENVDLHLINIGNILPGQTAKVEIIIIYPLILTAGAYDFAFPTNYVPKYVGSCDDGEKRQKINPSKMISKLKND